MFRNTDRKDINGLSRKVLAFLLALLFVFSCVFGVTEESDDTANPIQDITETESVEDEIPQDAPEDAEAADNGEEPEEIETAPKYEGPYHLYFVYSDSKKNSLNDKKAQLSTQITKYEKACLDIAHAMLKSGRADEVYVSKLFVDAGRNVKCLEEEAICKFWEQNFLRVSDAIAKNLNDKIIEFSDDETAIVIIFFGDEFSGINDDEKWKDLENNENFYIVAERESQSKALNSRRFSIEEIEEKLYGDYYDANEYRCIYDREDVANNRMPDFLQWNEAANKASLAENTYFQHVIISKDGEMMTLRDDSEPVSIKSKDITRIWASEDRDHKTRKQIFDENVELIRNSMWIAADDEQDRFIIYNVPQIDGIRVDFVSKHVIDGSEQESVIVSDDVTVYGEPMKETEDTASDGDDAEETDESEIESEDDRQEEVVVRCYAPVARGDWYLDVCITNDEDQFIDEPRFDGFGDYITIQNHVPTLMMKDAPNEVDFGFYVALDSTSEIGSKLDIGDYYEDLDGDELFWVVDGKKTDSPLYSAKNDGAVGEKVHVLKAIDCADGIGKEDVKVTYRMDDILELFSGETAISNRNGEDEIHKGDLLNVTLKLKNAEELPDYANWSEVEEYLSNGTVAVKHRGETVPMVYDAENRILNCELVTDAEKSGEGTYEVVLRDKMCVIPVEGNSYQVVNVPLSIIGGDGQDTVISERKDDLKPNEEAQFIIPLSKYIAGEENDILSLKAEWNGMEIGVGTCSSKSNAGEAKEDKNYNVSWDGKENIEVRFSGLKFFCSDKDTLKLTVTDQDGSSAVLTAEFTMISLVRKHLPYAIGVVVAVIAVIIILCIRVNTEKGLVLNVQYTTSNNECMSGTANAGDWHGHKLSLYQIVLLTDPMPPVPVDAMDTFRKTYVRTQKNGKIIKVCSVGKGLTRETGEDAVIFEMSNGVSIQLKPLESSSEKKTQ